jgi:hypothetical protein
MRSLASYILAALLIGIALNFAAPASSVNGALAKSWPSADQGQIGQQVVNRDGKSDRLLSSGTSSRNIQTNTQIKTVREIAPKAPSARSVLKGCDPAFSPLSASARLNYSSRCVADNSSPFVKAS